MLESDSRSCVRDMSRSWNASRAEATNHHGGRGFNTQQGSGIQCLHIIVLGMFGLGLYGLVPGPHWPGFVVKMSLLDQQA